MKKLIFIGICVVALIVALIAVGRGKADDGEEFPAEIINPSADSTTGEVPTGIESESESESEGNSESVVEETTYKDAEILRVTKFTTPVGAGEEVVLSISGIPNTRYDIYVYYSQNPAESDDLAPRYSDGDGNITWKWTVPSSVKEGRREIAIVGGGEILRIYLDIE